MSEIRFVITGKNTQGLRTLAEPRQRRYTYDTAELAQEKLNYIHTNNNPNTVKYCMGTELEVKPVECFKGGDPVTCWFDTLEETEAIISKK